MQTMTTMLAAFFSRVIGSKRSRVECSPSIDVGSAGEVVWKIGNYSQGSRAPTRGLRWPRRSSRSEIKTGIFGSNNKEHPTLYLDMPCAAAHMPDLWSRKVHLTFSVKNQKTLAETVTRTSSFCLAKTVPRKGLLKFLKLQVLCSPTSSFVVDNKLILTAQVKLEQ